MVERLRTDFHTPGRGSGSIAALESNTRIVVMKKGIVVLLVGLALIVLISPGLIGKLAEQNLDANIRTGIVENEDIVVTAAAFERGWFTTEGQHRVELKGGDLSVGIREFFDLDPDAPLPVLIINTRVDHGLIPLASMARKDGSLAPGLGDAVSTLHLEMPDGSTIDLPGAVNSHIGLTGNLVSDYALPAGSYSEDDIDVTWGDASLEVAAQAVTGRVRFDADVASLDVGGNGQSSSATQLRFTSEQQPSAFGYPLGEARLEVESLTTPASESLGPLVMNGSGRVEDDRLRLDFAMDLAGQAPGIGDARSILELTFRDVDPEAFGRLLTRYQAVARDPELTPEQMAALLDEDARALVADGLSVDVPRLDLTLPAGTLESTLEVTISPTDPADFAWSSLLLDTEASADVRIPEPLMEFVLAANPQAGAAIGMGFLKKDGDAYVSEIRYAKGILAVNGAPMPIPLPMP